MYIVNISFIFDFVNYVQDAKFVNLYQNLIYVQFFNLVVFS